MGSNGGILEAAETVAMPAMAVELGPAAGVVAAALVARQTGHRDLLSFDMGGTTAKASLIRDGQYETTPEYEVGGGASGNRWMHGTGHPIRVPVIDLAEVSAGGGSIAWVDRAGSLRVGPKSAGAEPGPVCYGRGGTRADRDRLQPAARLSRQGLAAGRRPADRPCRGRGRGRRAPGQAAGRRCAHRGGRRDRRRQPRHGGGPEDRLRAARARSARLRAGGVRRRRAAACGGAGRRARHRPRDLPADPRRVLGAGPGRQRPASATTCAPSTRPPPRPIRQRSRPRFAELERDGAAMLDRAGVAPERRRFERSIDARYERQSYELAVPVAGRCSTPPRCAASPTPSTTATGTPTATTTAASRCSSSACASRPSAPFRRSPSAPPPAPAGTDAVKAPRQVWFRGTGAAEATIYDRGRMPAGFDWRRAGGDRVARVHHPCPARLAGSEWTTTASCI